MSSRVRRIAGPLLFLAIVIVAIASSPVALAKVKAVSTDGEATVYLRGNFAAPFDLVYRVQLRPQRLNKSWALLNLALLSYGKPGGVGLGLSTGSPHPNSVVPFLSVTTSKNNTYTALKIHCNPCLVELQGDRGAIHAYVERRLVGTWWRQSLGLANSYVQLNGEVSRVGDRIDGLVVPIRTTLKGARLGAPTCAFTTQGVEVRYQGKSLRYEGLRDSTARVTFYSLLNGKTGDSCP